MYKRQGVDAEGTKKEIAARCAAVEVDIPDDNELTEEDKKAAEMCIRDRHTEQDLCRNCNICIMCQTAANVMQQQQWRLRGRA